MGTSINIPRSEILKSVLREDSKDKSWKTSQKLPVGLGQQRKTWDCLGVTFFCFSYDISTQLEKKPQADKSSAVQQVYVPKRPAIENPKIADSGAQDKGKDVVGAQTHTKSQEPTLRDKGKAKIDESVTDQRIPGVVSSSLPLIIRDPVGADRQRISPAVQQVDGFQTSSGSGQQQIVTASADIAVQTRPVMAGAASTENVHISSLKEGGTSSSAPVSEVQSVSKDGLGVSLQHQVQSSALVEGSFTDPESDEDPVHTFNSFGVLENIQDGMDGELPKVSLSRSPPATSSPRKTKSIRHSRRNSAGNLKECDITLQQLKDFQGVLNRRVASPSNRD